MVNCPYCGTKLIETTWERKYCPNCGIIDEPEEGGTECSYIR
ncbi:MAG: hypothetical protein ACTSPI_01315 [Candidatus Heimdallarchaeaceae archaeon]